QTQVKVLQSVTLKKRVVARLAKAGFGGYQAPDRLAKIRHVFGMAAAASAPPNTPPATAKIRVLENSRMIEIEASSPDPRDAAGYADALATEFIDYNMEAVWQSAQKQSDWMSRQLQDLRTKLEQSENQLQSYTHDAGLLFTGQGQEENVDDAQLRQLQKSLADAQADRISKQSAYEIASTPPAESRPRGLGNGRLSEYQTKVADLRRQYAEQSSIYTPSHYKVAQLQAQITDLENTVRRERSNIVARIQNDFQAALRRERMLQTAYTAQMQRVTDL